MVRLVHLNIPWSIREDVLNNLSQKDNVFGVADFAGSTTTCLIVFRVAPKHVNDIVDELCSEFRIGTSEETGIDIMQLQSTIPRIKKSGQLRTKRRYNIHERDASAEEIYDVIDSQSHLTCDYIGNCFVAALIAAAGLASDSSPTVVASMLVSPLMGPILCGTFGAAISNWELVRLGIRNEAFGMVICLVVGLLSGTVLAFSYGPLREGYPELVSQEIATRTTYHSLIAGVFVAIPSGAGVALGITSGGINALVGVAISAALLPPMVNTGLCLAFAIWEGAFNYTEDANEYVIMAGFSFALFALNIFCIFLFAYLVFKLKNVNARSFADRNSITWNFGSSERCSCLLRCLRKPDHSELQKQLLRPRGDSSFIPGVSSTLASHSTNYADWREDSIAPPPEF